MFVGYDGEEYDSEEDYLDSLKCEDSYHFSVPFEFIEKNYGDGEYDIASTEMEVDVTWSDFNHGYEVSFEVPEMYLIDPAEGNGDEQDFFDDQVEAVVLRELEDLGIDGSALCSW